MTLELEHAPTRKKRARKRLTFLGVLQEVFILIAVVGGLFVVWWLWAGDFIDGLFDNQAASEISAEWNYTDTDKGWLGGVDVPVTATPTVEAENFGVIYAPRYGTDYVRTIAEGTEVWNVLNEGWFGHYEGVAGMGEVGNFAIAAHRTTYGAPMFAVDTFKVGDPVIVQSAEGWYVYRITETYVTLPTAIETIYPVPGSPAGTIPTQRWMTMTTCHPLYSAAERYIAHAIFDRFIPAGQMTPEEVTTAADVDTTVYVTTSVPEQAPSIVATSEDAS